MGHCRQGAKAVCEQHKDEGGLKRGEEEGGDRTAGGRMLHVSSHASAAQDSRRRRPIALRYFDCADDVTFDACFLVYLACVLASYLMTSCRKGTYTGRRQEQVTRCK